MTDFSGRQKILTVLGLGEVMTIKANDGVFPSEVFLTYTPHDYHDSEREARDEVHRMREVVLLHKSSGLRLEYLTSESYFGDEHQYRLRSIFIITKEHQKMEVQDVDFVRMQFVTMNGHLPFSGVKTDVRGD